MARLSDHTLRDAEHALRTEITLILGQYGRRMLEMGKAHIQEAIESSEEDDVNGTAIGRTAAQRAATPYFGGLAGDIPTVVESKSPKKLDA